MPDRKFDKTEDRYIALLDEKQRLIDLMENAQMLPETGIYDEPVRYFKANLKWTPIIFGWLSWLQDVAGWAQANGENFAGIQALLIFEEGIELPTYELDCGDVEDCLSTSDIIASLISQIDSLQTQIEELEYEAPIGGGDLPATPTMPSGANNLCRSAHYIADKLYADLVLAWTQAEALTWDEFLDAIFGTIWFNFENAKGFWQYAQTVGIPLLDESAGDYKSQIADAFFCAELSLTRALEIVASDATIPTNEKGLWLAIIDNYTQSQIDEWGLIGTLRDGSPDCTEGCPWVVVFDFSGLYVPDNSETLIILGNSWTVTGGEFVEGVGYVANQDQMILSNDLPEQCRMMSYYWTMAKGSLMLAADAYLWWHGADGLGVPQYSSNLRTLSNDYGIHAFTVNGNPIMNQTRILLDAYFSGGTSGHKIGWVKLVGTGAYPQS